MKKFEASEVAELKARGRSIAVIAGGCFWGMEHLLKSLRGVLKTECGYCGGEMDSPTYQEVKMGKTGHAEAVWIELDPTQLSYIELLQFFFRIHDPTTTNRQGGDIGTQYRSTIFWLDDSQRDEAERTIRAIDQSGFWKNPVVTTLQEFDCFYEAEDYHQDYLDKNPDGYNCHFFRERPS